MNDNRLVIFITAVICAGLITFGRYGHSVDKHESSRATIRGVGKRKTGDGVVTRLVSCGGVGANLTGNDSQGQVVTPGTTTDCTVLFERSNDTRSCVIDGGTIVKLTSTDLVVTKITSNHFSYTCE